MNRDEIEKQKWSLIKFMFSGPLTPVKKELLVKFIKEIVR